MKDEPEEEELLRHVTLENARSTFLARQRAEAELRRTQETLAQQSEWLRVTLSSIGDGVVTTDTEGKVVSLNKVAAELTGWTPEEAVGRRISEVFHIVNEVTRELVDNPAERALVEGRIVGLANHTVLIAKSGTEVPIDDSAAPIQDEEGRVYGVILIFRSVLERKQAEAALRQSEQELSDFFENASVGLHWVGPDGTILRVNRAELNLLGYSPEEYLGHDIVEFHVDRDVIAAILRRLAAGETLRDYEAQMRCRDGSIKDVLIDSTVLWRNDRFIHTRCITRDVTDRKQAEEAQARLAAIVESSQDAIIGKTLDSRITSWNAAAEYLFGYSAAEAVGQQITMLIPAERQDEEDKIIARLRQGERIEHFETVRIRKDGTTIDVSLTISPICDSRGRIIGASKIARDITTQKKAARRLATQYGIAQVLAESASLQEAAPKILQIVCQHPEWQLGILWRVDEEGKLLRCVEVCHAASRQSSRFEEESRRRVFQKGAGLPGRVWKRGESIWIADIVQDEDFLRETTAAAEGIRSAFGFPIRLNAHVLGVLEFFGSEARKRDAELVEMMTAVGSQIGQFIDRKRSENLLRESESRFRQLADVMPQIVWAAQPDGVIDYYNERWYEYTGLLRESPPQDGWAAILHPDDRARWKELYSRSIQTGELHSIEHRFKDRRTGGYRWFLCRAHPVLDAQGRVTRWFGTCTDINDTKRAEQSSRFQAEASAVLAELTDRNSTLQKVASLAVPHFADWCAVDVVESDASLSRLAVTHVDRAKIELVYQLERRFPPRASESRGVREVIRTGRSEWVSSIPDEMLVMHSRGGEHLRIIRELGLKSYICVALKSREQVVGCLTFATAESGRVYDESDLRAAEDLASRAVIAIENANLVAALKESDRRKDEFLAMLAHELRNPLAPARNALQILRAKGSPAPELQWAREMIDRQIHQMTRLVDDLLDVSRITRGKIELRKEQVELRSVVNDAIEASRPFIEKRGHTLSVDFPPETIVLDADPTRLSQVLQNLLNNAGKYMDDGGRIWLTARREKAQVVIGVRDTGIGIPVEMLPRIFEMFTQVDRSIERSQGGLGIGLTLVERLVSLHGGGVEAKSAGSGKGSEFIVRLPLAMVKEQAPHNDSAETKSTPAALCRILVVDDNQDSADSMAVFLRIIGHEVETAHDGLVAIEKAEIFQPDVILLDVGLPGLSGYKVAERIRERRGNDVMLIAVTGWGQEEDRRRSKQAGLDHHLTKPIEFEYLQTLLADRIKRAGNE